MTKTTQIIYGHIVEIFNETGDYPDIDDIRESIEKGDKEGILLWDGFMVGIGRWYIVNEWKEIADKLYEELSNCAQWIELEDSTSVAYKLAKKVMNKYEKLCNRE